MRSPLDCDASVALVVVSAPAYPTATFDPIAEVAALAAERGVACHVDACIGGFALPWWRGGDLPAWDFRLPGVTSISADLHKYGYAPKGASVLLQRGRDRQRMQYFATTRWMGYPVVNSDHARLQVGRSLAAAWAIVHALGAAGFAQLTATAERATDALVAVVNGIEGLRVVGDPVGPLFAAAVDESVPADRRVDPHQWADAVRGHGFIIQLQPGLSQADGTRVPHTTHLTITPVTEAQLPALTAALVDAADEVRGVPQASADGIIEALGPVLDSFGGALPDSEQAAGLLAAVGIGADGAGLPSSWRPCSPSSRRCRRRWPSACSPNCWRGWWSR